MLSPPFPSPKLTAWVTLIFASLFSLIGIAEVTWIIFAMSTSPEPVGAFACVLVPLALTLLVIVALIVETVQSFRRAYEKL